ncbi:MAG: glutamate 5-kinase [Chloroflexi bacterium]|nr:glutamate 5-kinase [Chloroflexota bacterium]MCZ6707904.1 glutamate 5-kinase [Chloroflexota bacterium]
MAESQALAGRRIVAKFGTKLLTGGGQRLSAEVMSDLVRQVATLVQSGVEVAIVTSGAVAAGHDRLGTHDGTSNIERRQVLAAIGQSHLVERYDTLLREHGLIAAQALLTRADLSDRAGYLNARNTLEGLLGAPQVVPVINENDVVADDELRGGAFGENDGLSALVANLIDADLLVLLSDVQGLYEVDPRIEPDATPIAEVADFEAALRSAGPPAADTGPGRRRGSGRGGMRAKVEAARLATSSGCVVVVAHGQEPDALLRIAAGEALGTRFPAAATKQESRKRWLLSGLEAAGAIVVDEGAVRALQDAGRSLLAAGIVGVTGEFERGDVVEVQGPGGTRIAVGISDYGSREIEAIRGQQSNRIAEILGYELGEEVIHRNNLVVL